ncbi:UDP-glucose 4-epimerase GalE [Patescibacteria group bacterium]|nr:UDP-glucose 4-epimerase GalE [Patescibacteria group bacterium]
MNKHKILITGAGGYIGSVSTYLFLQKGYEVVALDDFSTGNREALEFLQTKFNKEQFRFYQIDLHDDLSPIFNQEQGIEAVIHYAASCLVDESMKNPQKYFYNNVCGTQNLLATLLRYGIKNIVFSSTCAVYGEANYVPVDEKHPTDPKNPYGESKLMIERMIEWLCKLQELNYVILRYFNVCGASDDGLIGDSKTPSVLLVQNAVRGALGIEPFFLTCPKVNTPDGTPIRDYINVVDLNLAHLKAVEYLLKGKNSQIINLGTGQGNSVLEIIKKVEEMTGYQFDLQKTDPRQGEYAEMIASIEKAEKLLDWKPQRTIKDSIESLVKWYKEHPQGWSEAI